MSRDDHKEQMRCQVERLLATNLSVAEWCDLNKVLRQTMYYWLSYFAENEPELFGGKQNIVDSSKRRWVESTRKNMAASKALAGTHPAEIVIVDDSFSPTTNLITPHKLSDAPIDAVHVDIKGAHIVIPAGTDRIDIENVVGVIASL